MIPPSGILLAGGASRRFGRPKLVALLGGVPLFHHPLRALLASCGEVVVVLSPSADEPPLPLGAERVRFVRDRTEYAGPLAGTAAGLVEVRGERAVVAGGDMPGLRPEVIALMAGHAARSEASAVVLADDDGPRPLPAVLHVAAATAVAEELLSQGERRLRALIERLDPAVLDRAAWSIADADGRWLVDVDTPADLTRG